MWTFIFSKKITSTVGIQRMFRIVFKQTGCGFNFFVASKKNENITRGLFLGYFDNSFHTAFNIIRNGFLIESKVFLINETV